MHGVSGGQWSGSICDTAKQCLSVWRLLFGRASKKSCKIDLLRFLEKASYNLGATLQALIALLMQGINMST